MERLEGRGETGHSSSFLGATVSKGVMEGSGFLLENLEAPASLKMVFLMFCYLWVWRRARDIYLEVRTGPPTPPPDGGGQKAFSQFSGCAWTLPSS